MDVIFGVDSRGAESVAVSERFSDTVSCVLDLRG